jgi:hypothetical protein
MLSGTTLFGFALVLIIGTALIILLIRKPHIPMPFSSEEKTNKDKEESQTIPKPCPHHIGYLSAFPKNTPIPKECRGCTKIMECQVGLNKLQKLFREEEPSKETLKEEAPEEEEAPEQIEAPKPKTPSETIHARPPECSHFFGYLKGIPKNTLIPDECFRCPKMVQCIYYNAAAPE